MPVSGRFPGSPGAVGGGRCADGRGDGPGERDAGRAGGAGATGPRVRRCGARPGAPVRGGRCPAGERAVRQQRAPQRLRPPGGDGHGHGDRRPGRGPGGGRRSRRGRVPGLRPGGATRTGGGGCGWWRAWRRDGAGGGAGPDGDLVRAPSAADRLPGTQPARACPPGWGPGGRLLPQQAAWFRPVPASVRDGARARMRPAIPLAWVRERCVTGPASGGQDVPGARAAGATNVPRPCRVMISPRSRRIPAARRMVM